MVHFIGKDILYFHALFWPAMLRFAGYRTPNRVYAHGFLTVDGQKMSKSRGTFITAETYLQQGLNPEWLRYYYAAKLGPSMEDIDLNLEDFVARVNSDLVGKYVNIAPRAPAGFRGRKRFGGRLIEPERRAPARAPDAAGPAAVRLPRTTSPRPTSGASTARRCARSCGSPTVANQYADQHKPWELAKQPGQTERLHQVCSELLNAFRILTIYLKPILPHTAERVEAFMNLEGKLDWQHLGEYPRAPINEYQHLMTRAEASRSTRSSPPTRKACNRPRQPHSPQRHAQHQENVVAQSTPLTPALTLPCPPEARGTSSCLLPLPRSERGSPRRARRWSPSTSS